MVGRCSCVSTSMTPLRRSAALVSMRRIRPFAIVDDTTLAYARPGVLNSAAYFAEPVTFARPSARETGLPIYAMFRSRDFLVGLRLLRAARGLRQRADNRSARQ